MFASSNLDARFPCGQVFASQIAWAVVEDSVAFVDGFCNGRGGEDAGDIGCEEEGGGEKCELHGDGHLSGFCLWSGSVLNLIVFEVVEVLDDDGDKEKRQRPATALIYPRFSILGSSSPYCRPASATYKSVGYINFFVSMQPSVLQRILKLQKRTNMIQSRRTNVGLPFSQLI